MPSTPVISEEYRAMNRELHLSNKDYGTSGHRWAPFVRSLVRRHRLADVLDYGCGKQTLAKALPDLEIKGYDPAFEELSAPPAPADLVICGDVLEHVEPQHLDAVFDDIARCTRRFAFLVVATRPAQKALADGRNAHLCQFPANRWLSYVLPRFEVKYMADHLRALEKPDWRQRLAKWAHSDLDLPTPHAGEVVFLLARKTRPD